MQKSLKKFSIVYVYIIALASMYGINSGFSNMRQVAFIAVLAISVFLPTNIVLIIFYQILPFCQLMQLSGSFTVLPFLCLIIIAKEIIKLRKIHKAYFGTYFGMLLLSVIASLNWYNSIMPVIPFFVYLLMVYIVTHNKDCITTSNKEESMILFIISVLLVCVGSKLFPNTVSVVSNKTEWTVRNTGFSSVWDFGQNIVCAICMIVLLIVNKSAHKKFMLFLTLPINVVLLYFLIDTGLYTGLVGLAFFVFMVPFLYSNSNVRKKILYVFIAYVGIVLVALIAYQTVFTRMLENRGQFSANGRMELWQFYINDFFSSWKMMLFGVGAGAINQYAAIVGKLTTHNALLEKLVEFGIIGFVLLLTNIKAIYKDSIKGVSKNGYLLLPLVYLVMGMFQGISGSEVMYALIVLSYAKQEVANNTSY